MNDTIDDRRSLYRALGALGANNPGFGDGETIVTERVETVDGDRMIEALLDFASDRLSITTGYGGRGR